MCIACEMGFWMAMDEPQRTAAKAKRKSAPEAEAFACDAPADKPARRPPAAPRKTRRQGQKTRAARA